ncbi:MAG: hypothetical protein FJW37_10545 [Acidobacteria bacterium]|nr:hypothetical protein [Acidobacteriota bacterium]
MNIRASFARAALFLGVGAATLGMLAFTVLYYRYAFLVERRLRAGPLERQTIVFQVPIVI